MSRFDVCHAITAKWEGGWSNHPADPGGKTMYGVTQAVYHTWLRKRNRPIKPVRQISKTEALQIYKQNYWTPTVQKYNLVPGVDLATYDAAVNSGVGRAKKWLIAAVGSADHTVTVKKLCGKRLGFMQSLKIWKNFGRGWSRRVADIEARGVKMALAFATTDVKSGLEKEAKQAEKTKKTQEKVAGGTAAGGAGGGAVSVETLPAAYDYWVLAGIGLTIVIAGLLVWRSRIHKQRQEAYLAVAGEK